MVDHACKTRMMYTQWLQLPKVLPYDCHLIAKALLPCVSVCFFFRLHFSLKRSEHFILFVYLCDAFFNCTFFFCQIKRYKKRVTLLYRNGSLSLQWFVIAFYQQCWFNTCNLLNWFLERKKKQRWLKALELDNCLLSSSQCDKNFKLRDSSQFNEITATPIYKRNKII